MKAEWAKEEEEESGSRLNLQQLGSRSNQTLKRKGEEEEEEACKDEWPSTSAALIDKRTECTYGLSAHVYS